jgi:SNF2 family DNA or RNA helicase
MVARGGAGAFLDPGLGKTSISLAVIKQLRAKGLIQRTLIVAPMRVCHMVWPYEAKKWSNFKDMTCAILHGSKKAEAARQDVDFFLINPEGLAWLFSDKNKALVKAMKIDCLIVDESSKFKRTKTQRFKIIRKILPMFKRRYILTGSPTPNGLLDLFGQMYIVDMGEALGEYITWYRREYFYDIKMGAYSKYEIKPGSADRIEERIKNKVIRMDAKDYLELPHINYNKVTVELPGDARKAYEEMEKEMFSIFSDEKIISAVSAAAASIKCRQIANGGIYLDPEFDEDSMRIVKSNEWREVHAEKTEAVLDIVEELQGKPCLISYEFAHDKERLLKALGKNTPVLGGGASVKTSIEIEKAWNNGSIPVLLGHPQAMGHGLNLQGSGNTIIFHSLTWNYELYDQFIKRIARQGSKHKSIMVHHIIAEGTIDEVMLSVLYGKKQVQTDFMNALRKYALIKQRK